MNKTMAYVLALDFGTSGCRSAIFDENLKMLCLATQEYPLIVRSEREIEQDADLWWQCTLNTMCEAVAQAPVDSRDIRAISISSQGISFVPIDKAGNALCNAISWLDSRAIDELEALEKRYGKAFLYRRTGKRLSPAYTLSKLMWFRANAKALYDKTWKILMPLDYIQFRLTGRCMCDHTMAGGSMYYDVRTQTWADDLLTDLGIAREKLPDIAWAGEPVGMLLHEVASRVGLSGDVLVVNGAQDQKCAALGAGAACDTAAISLGTGSCIAQLASAPTEDPLMRIPFFSYVRKGLWDLEGVINTAGSAYSWFRNEFAGNRSFDAINEAAAGVALPNPVKFYPYLAGSSSPHWDDAVGCFTGFSLNTGLGNAARAVMEGIAYNIRANLEAMASVCERAKELRLYGGGSKSDLWCTIISEVTGTPVVRLSSSETALAGAAMLAFRALDCPVPASLAPGARFMPDPRRVKIYDECYREYEQLRARYFASR